MCLVVVCLWEGWRHMSILGDSPNLPGFYSYARSKRGRFFVRFLHSPNLETATAGSKRRCGNTGEHSALVRLMRFGHSLQLVQFAIAIFNFQKSEKSGKKTDCSTTGKSPHQSSIHQSIPRAIPKVLKRVVLRPRRRKIKQNNWRAQETWSRLQKLLYRLRNDHALLDLLPHWSPWVFPHNQELHFCS